MYSEGMPINIDFAHGLGDCVSMSHVLSLYVKRGYSVNLRCDPSKAIVFAPSGVNVNGASANAYLPVEYPHGPGDFLNYAGEPWRFNKAANVLNHDPLPNIGDKKRLWNELCSLKLDLRPFIQSSCYDKADRFLAALPKPIVLLHSQGNTFAKQKNIPDEVAIRMYTEILDRFDGTLVLLDWDQRVPKLSNYRVRHLQDDWERPDVETLAALMDRSDLLVSVDSGPLHLSRMMDTPSLGLLFSPFLHPTHVLLPSDRQANLVQRSWSHDANVESRVRYNIIEDYAGEAVDPTAVAKAVARMLSGPRWLSTSKIGADMMLQQCVFDYERGYPCGLSAYVDRYHGFDIVLRHAARFEHPRIVETGCIRADDDWRGAGYATYLLAAFCEKHGGTVDSVDVNESNCQFAIQKTKEMSTLKLHCSDSVVYLRSRSPESIDVLLLDSMDTDVPGHQDHALREIQASSAALHSDSIVMFDDTPWRAGQWLGKGGMAVPWMLDNGWSVVHSGYQTALTRSR